MKIKRDLLIILIGATLLIILAGNAPLRSSAALRSAVASAGPNGVNEGLTVSWYTLDNGGGTSTGGGYTLFGTAGQPEDSRTEHSGGSFSLRGGFWQPGLFIRKLFVPLVNR